MSGAQGRSKQQFTGYLASVLGVASIAAITLPVQENTRSITVGASCMVLVLLMAMTWGTGPALLSSLLSTIYLDYFIVSARMKLNLSLNNESTLLALVSFFATSFLVGQLSSRAEKRARLNRRLYDQLLATFHQTSQLEAVKRSERFKSALLNTVTHDLRTPLTSIKAATTTLLQNSEHTSKSPTLDRDSEAKLLGIILALTDRLNRFVEEMIELARIESSQEGIVHNAEQIPMEEVVSAAVARAEDVLRNHILKVDCEDDLLAAAGPKAIAQVVFSLLENAGTHTPPGTTIRVLARSVDRDTIEVAVEDEGSGVPPEIRERVFDKFFRGGETQAPGKNMVGLGLGLAVARGIVEASGGRIWVEDRNPGPGARFVFTLPAGAKLETPQLSEAAK